MRWFALAGFALALSVTPISAQANCAIVAVGPASGIYFLAVTNTCGAAPDGYLTVSDLVRDDGGSHVLIILENGRNDPDTRSIAGTLSNLMKSGGVDGHQWKPAPEPAPTPPPVVDEPPPPADDGGGEVAQPPAEELPVDQPAPAEPAPPPPADEGTSE